MGRRDADRKVGQGAEQAMYKFNHQTKDYDGVCNITPIDRPGTGVLPPFKGRPGKSPLVELMLMMRAAADPPRPYRFSRGNAALVTRMGP